MTPGVLVSTASTFLCIVVSRYVNERVLYVPDLVSG